MKYLVPQGIGDVVWALLKIEDINSKLKGGDINVRIACMNKNYAPECRSLDFVSRFSFVNSVEMYEMPHYGQSGAVLLPGHPSDENGYHRYIPDGKTNLPGIDYVLMPNAPLERGIRLEDWLPQFEINWNVMDKFRFKEGEICDVDKPFVAFFCGSTPSNTIAGHNRGPMWTSLDWSILGDKIRDKGFEIVVVGSDDDRSYFESINGHEKWIDRIGLKSIGHTFAILKQAKFMISYQSGIGIVPNYWGVPLGIFWRPRGSSISEHLYISFEESMASAWANPEMIKSGKHMSLIYSKHGIDYIISEAEDRQWF